MYSWVCDYRIYLSIIVTCKYIIYIIYKTQPGADFTKGLKSRFRLKFKTLVGLNFVKRT